MPYTMPYQAILLDTPQILAVTNHYNVLTSLVGKRGRDGYAFHLSRLSVSALHFASIKPLPHDFAEDVFATGVVEDAEQNWVLREVLEQADLQLVVVL